MPQIIDFAYNYTTSTTGTTVACDIPDTASGDILLAVITADTGTMTFSSTGWTAVTGGAFSNTTRTYLMWRVSTGASEPLSYTFTASAGETFNIIIISIRDCDTTTPFVTPVGVNRAGNNTAFPSITTNRADSLILYLGSHPSTAAIPSSIENNIIQLFSMDGSAHSDSIGWGFKRAIGATGTTVPSSVSGTTYGGSLVTLAVRAPASGAALLPAYCTEDLSVFLDPIHGITAFRGNSAFAATATTYYTGTNPLGGKSIANATISARLDTGINSYRSTGGMSSAINRTWQGGVTQFSAAKTNLAGKNILCHVQTYLPADIQTLEGIGLSRGVSFGMHTSAGNWKSWHVHGANTPFGTKMTPVVINTNNTTGVIGSVGSLNVNSVGGLGFFVSGFVASADMIWTMAWALDKTTVCGGNISTPVNIPGIVSAISNGHERFSALQQGKNQMLVLQPFQIGNGGTDGTYLDVSTAAIEFPQQYNVASQQVFYCSANNVAGVTFYPGPSDYMDISSSVWSSSSKFHWGFNPSSSSSATVITDGAQVIGAGTITLSDNVNLSGLTFQSCDQITAAANTMTNMEFNSSTATSVQGAISITGATQIALQTALDKFVNCSWNTNTIPGGALRIIYTGAASSVTLNMTSGSFSGNTADIRWEAPASSPLVINLSGGANASTYTSTNSNLVTFSNPKQFVVTNIVDGTEVRIYRQSDLVELGGAENVGASPAGLNNVTVSSDADNAGRYKVTYSYNYTVDLPIFVVVLHNNYQALRPAFTLKSVDSSLQVSQISDRQYNNPI